MAKLRFIPSKAKRQRVLITLLRGSFAGEFVVKNIVLVISGLVVLSHEYKDK